MIRLLLSLPLLSLASTAAIHPSTYPIWHGYACQEPCSSCSSLLPVKRPKVPKIPRQDKKERVSRMELGDRAADTRPSVRPPSFRSCPCRHLLGMDELGTECERLNAMMGLYLNARKCFIICVVQDRTFIAPQDSPTIKTLTLFLYPTMNGLLCHVGGVAESINTDGIIVIIITATNSTITSKPRARASQTTESLTRPSIDPLCKRLR